MRRASRIRAEQVAEAIRKADDVLAEHYKQKSKASYSKRETSISEYKDRSSGGEEQSSGGAVSSSGEVKTIINERRTISDEEMASALEWKPWYYRPEEPKPGRSSEDYQKTSIRSSGEANKCQRIPRQHRR